MLEGGKVTNRQLFQLLTTVIIATAVLIVPAITGAIAKRDAWLSLLVVATAYGLLVTMVMIKLGLKFPCQTVIEYAPLLLGKVPGKLVGLAYVLWFIHVNSVIVREFSDFLLSAFMPETPLTAFSIILLVLAGWGAKGGLEVICRSSEWVFPLFFFLLLGIIVLVAPDADWNNLLPVMENGINPVLRGGLAPAGWRGEIILMLMFLPYSTSPRQAGKYIAASVIFTGLVLTAVTITTTAVLAQLTEHLTFPFFSLARYISLGRFLERVESLVLLMWVAGVTIKVAAFYYAAVLGTAQLCGLKEYRPLIFPIGLILAAWSNGLFENISALRVWLSAAWPPYAYTFELFLPAMLLLAAVLRGKGSRNGN